MITKCIDNSYLHWSSGSPCSEEGYNITGLVTSHHTSHTYSSTTYWLCLKGNSNAKTGFSQKHPHTLNWSHCICNTGSPARLPKRAVMCLKRLKKMGLCWNTVRARMRQRAWALLTSLTHTHHNTTPYLCNVILKYNSHHSIFTKSTFESNLFWC